MATVIICDDCALLFFLQNTVKINHHNVKQNDLIHTHLKANNVDVDWKSDLAPNSCWWMKFNTYHITFWLLFGPPLLNFFHRSIRWLRDMHLPVSNSSCQRPNRTSGTRPGDLRYSKTRVLQLPRQVGWLKKFFNDVASVNVSQT